MAVLKLYKSTLLFLVTYTLRILCLVYHLYSALIIESTERYSYLGMGSLPKHNALRSID